LKQLLIKLAPIFGITGSTLSLFLFSLQPLWQYVGVVNPSIAAPVFYSAAFFHLLAIVSYILIFEINSIGLFFIWFGFALNLQLIFLSKNFNGLLFLILVLLAAIGAIGISLNSQIEHKTVSKVLGLVGTTLALIMLTWQPIWNYLVVDNFTSSPIILIAAFSQLLAIVGYVLFSDFRKLSLILIWLGIAVIFLFVLLGIMSIGLFFLPSAGFSFFGATGLSFSLKEDGIRFFGLTISTLALLFPVMVLFLSLISKQLPLVTIVIVFGQLLGLFGYTFAWKHRKLRLFLIWTGVVGSVAISVFFQTLSFFVITLMLAIIATIISLSRRSLKVSPD